MIKIIYPVKEFFPIFVLMKTAQKITSVFLALIFLVSSLGFTVNKMVCLKSGKTRLSLLHIKDCCPEKESSVPVIKSNCCDLTNTVFNLGDLRVSHKSQGIQPLATQFLFSVSGFTFNRHSVVKPLTLSFADLPPPRYGRTLLSFISILTI